MNDIIDFPEMPGSGGIEKVLAEHIETDDVLHAKIDAMRYEHFTKKLTDNDDGYHGQLTMLLMLYAQIPSLRGAGNKEALEGIREQTSIIGESIGGTMRREDKQEFYAWLGLKRNYLSAAITIAEVVQRR